MRRTNIYLEERQCRALDHRAKREGISRAELVRRFIDAGLCGPEVQGVDGDLEAIRATAGAWRGRPVDELPHRDDRSDALETLWRDG